MSDTNQQIIKFKQILENQPNNLNVHLKLAEIYKGLGNYEESLNYILQAQQIDKSNEYVIANLGVIYYKMRNFELAQNQFDEVIRKNPAFITAYIHNALVQIEVNNIDKALQYLYKAQDLFKDNNKEYRLRLAYSHQKFIVQNLNRIVELEEQVQAQSMILASSFNQLQLDQQQDQETQEQYQILSNSIKSVFKGAGQQLEKITEYFSNYQQVNNSSSNNACDSTKIEEEQFESKKDILMYDEIQKLKQQVQNQQIQIDQIEQIAVKDKQALRTGWQNLEQQPEKLEYAQLFYFTLVNLFETYCHSKTGVLSVNQDHFMSEESQRKYKIAQLTSKGFEMILSKIPLCNEIFSGINQAVDQVYKKSQVKQVNDRLTAITSIIIKNKDPKFKTTDDQQISIALASIELANRKQNLLIDNQMEEENGTIKKIFNYFKVVVEKVSGPQNKVTHQEQEAFDDVVLLIAYMQNNYKKIIEQSQNSSIREIIVDCVINKKQIEV